MTTAIDILAGLGAWFVLAISAVLLWGLWCDRCARRRIERLCAPQRLTMTDLERQFYGPSAKDPL